MASNREFHTCIYQVSLFLHNIEHFSLFNSEEKQLYLPTRNTTLTGLVNNFNRNRQRIPL